MKFHVDTNKFPVQRQTTVTTITLHENILVGITNILSATSITKQTEVYGNTMQVAEDVEELTFKLMKIRDEILAEQRRK